MFNKFEYLNITYPCDIQLRSYNIVSGAIYSLTNHTTIYNKNEQIKSYVDAIINGGYNSNQDQNEDNKTIMIKFINYTNVNGQLLNFTRVLLLPAPRFTKYLTPPTNSTFIPDNDSNNDDFDLMMKASDNR